MKRISFKDWLLWSFVVGGLTYFVIRLLIWAVHLPTE